MAALWPEALVQSRHKKMKEVSAYMEMARPINLVPSFLLVFLGAWAGTGRTMTALRFGSVWLMSLLSSGVAVASVVVNDYFDFASGVDGVNSPDKPLPSGTIRPDGALLFASVIYIGVLMAACLMEPPLLRLIVAMSAGATLLYTPLLKRLTCVKNATVAAIIAASPIAGALAAGASSLGVRAVIAPCAFVFLAIMYREILMDIQDVEGDRAARVWTLPVMLGRKRALGVAVGLFATASVLGLAVAAFGSGLSWAWTMYSVSETVVRSLSALAVLYVVRPVLANAWAIWRNEFNRDLVRSAIDETLKPIGLGMLLLAAMA
ncbi:hypothetical protein WJX72_012464 [[Myrmecia] bisecta]|uniref:Prenyltransferase n=1 Tax=[Myrmecia] bisecta TaxID=41462 RepID=A0AAW1Q1X8_9CHLO